MNLYLLCVYFLDVCPGGVVLQNKTFKLFGGFLLAAALTGEVKMTDSQRLLAEYLKGLEPAFCESTSRYLDLVYSTAIRAVNDGIP